MGGARPIPPARETGRPARRWLGPWFPGAPRAPGWLRETSSDGRGGRAGCARRLCRHALPEGVVARGFCETECASSRPYYRPDTTFALVGTLSKSGRPFFEWVLPTLVINLPGAHPRVLSPSRESQFESSTGRRRFNCSNSPHYVDGSRDPAYRENRALPSTATILPARWARRFPASVVRLPAVSSGFLAFLRFTPRVS